MPIPSVLRAFLFMLALVVTGACTPEPSGLTDTGEPEDTGPVKDKDTGGRDTGRDTGDTGDTGSHTGDPPVEIDPGDPIEPPPYLSTAAIGRLTDELDDLVASTSSTIAVHVVDLDNGQVVYTNGADRWLKPASNTKLFTTALALDLLGRDHRPTVQVHARARPDGSGRISGDLVVTGQHDGTWSEWMHPDAGEPPRRIALALHRQGLRRVNGDLVVRGDFIWEAYKFGYLDPELEREEAASALWDALLDQGIVVDGAILMEDAPEPPAGLVSLSTWRGNSLEATSAIINRISHNEMADSLARHTAWSIDGRNDYAGHEALMVGWLADAGLDTAGFSLKDGSGLSHDNRVSPELVVGLFQTLDRLPARDAWLRSFSVAGYDGTLAGRMGGPSTRGRFLGKTGTLNRVICTSGILHHTADGHRYAISILANSVSSTNSQERQVHDRIVTAVAKDWRGGPDRPGVPEADGLLVQDGRLVLHLDPGAGSQGTEVWRSADGRTWLAEDATWHESDRVELPLDGLPYVKLLAVGPGGRSDFSDVRVARSGSGAKVLLVDGNDRWDTQDAENPLLQGHDFLARAAEALPGVRLDSIDNDALVSGLADPADYDAIVWLLGEESTEDQTFDPEEQALVADYVAGGGALVVSGSEVGWDLVEKGDAADRAFARDVLGGEYLGDDAGTWMVEPAEASFASLDVGMFLLPGYLVASYPDALAPGPSARVALSFGSPDAPAAAIRREDRPVLWLGFPAEALDDAADRQAVLMGALRALGVR